MRRTRLAVQLTFLATTVAGVFVVGGHAERWCVFGGVEALVPYAASGAMPCSLDLSNFCILGGVVVMTLLARRAFCAYVCPIGTIAELIGRGARRLGLRSLSVPARLDRILSFLKYGVLAAIVLFTYRAGELVFRGYDPCYVLLSRHGTDITGWAYAAAGAVALGSLAVSVPFCRWLCPLAAVLNPFSWFAASKIVRERAACASCGTCARVCPMAIPVDRVDAVSAARCTSCFECLAACGDERRPALRWTIAGGRAIRRPQALLLPVVVASIGAAVLAASISDRAPFSRERGEAPPAAAAASLELTIVGLECRDRAAALFAVLDRRDDRAIAGYLKFEAWPAPGRGRARVSYDAARSDANAIKRAIVEPLYDPAEDAWRMPPYAIEGWDPLADVDTNAAFGTQR